MGWCVTVQTRDLPSCPRRPVDHSLIYLPPHPLQRILRTSTSAISLSSSNLCLLSALLRCGQRHFHVVSDRIVVLPLAEGFCDIQ